MVVGDSRVDKQKTSHSALFSSGPQFPHLYNGQRSGLYALQELHQAVVVGWAAQAGRISIVPKFISRGFFLPPLNLVAHPRIPLHLCSQR